MRTNKQLINLLYNDVKNWTSSLSCCIGPKCVSSNNGTKALLFLCELHFSLIFKSQPLYHLRTKKQLINLLYNDVKNLTSILSYCIGPKCVSSKDDTKALFQCELHFSLIFTRRPLNHQRTNNLLTFSIMRWRVQVPFSAAAMVSTLYLQRKIESVISER